MHLDTLKIFCDLVHTGSFSEAAKRSHITQSAVSQQISALEKRFGVQLLERLNGGVTLTPEGRVLLTASEQIGPIFERAAQKIEEMKGQVKGTVRVATVLSIGLHELPPHVRLFRERFPDATVEVNYRKASQIYGDVLDGAADLGLMAFPKPRRGLAVQIYSRDRLCVICAPTHALAKKQRVKLSGLKDMAFVAFEPDTPTRQALDRILKIEHVKVNRVMEFDNIETVKRAVEIENAISIVPGRAASREVERGTLRAIEIDAPEEEIWRPLGILRRRSKALTPAMRAFVDLLLAEEGSAEK